VEEKNLSPDSPWKRLVENMDEFGRIMSTCRGRKITEGSLRVKESLKDAKASLQKEEKPGLSPLIHLLEKIEDKMRDFCDDDIKNGLQAVRWCIEHNMTQQGYTILREIVVTWLAKRHYGNKSEVYDERRRDIFSTSLVVIGRDIPEEEWTFSPKNKKKTRDIKNIADIKNMSNCFDELGKYRNDIDHSGCRNNPVEANELINVLGNYFGQIKDFILKENS